MDEAMGLLLPMVQNIMVSHLMTDGTQEYLAMQRLVLKIFYSMTQVRMNASFSTPVRMCGMRHGYMYTGLYVFPSSLRAEVT
jgi:hypothetical protein